MATLRKNSLTEANIHQPGTMDLWGSISNLSHVVLGMEMRPSDFRVLVNEEVWRTFLKGLNKPFDPDITKQICVAGIIFERMP